MTSFIIKQHISRQIPESWSEKGSANVIKPHAMSEAEVSCAFCRIIRGELPAYRVYEDEWVIAFLDILPLRPGHTLVIPKIHVSRLSELDPRYAGKLGESVSRVSNALVQVTGEADTSVLALENTALNVVCNQEYAQAVPHVHYHVIPAPNFRNFGNTSPTAPAENLGSSKSLPLSQKEMHKLEFEARSELDTEEGKTISAKIAAKM